MKSVHEDARTVWVFVGNGATLPCGVFHTLEMANQAIEKHKLSGMLTAYPMDTVIYEWAIDNGFFHPKRDSQQTPTFIQRFTSAALEHYHYIDGKESGVS